MDDIRSADRKRERTPRSTCRFGLLGSSGLAVLVALASPAAWAQDAAGGEASLEEIVVTARKVAENLQDVPVAVTAVTGEGLQRQNAVRVSDMANIAPGLTIKPSSNNGSSIQLQIRGQYQNDNLATLDPSVGVYVDGYYWARAYGMNADFLDIQSAQVLRGPQGTLFGRNTTGGALLIQTNDPRADRLSGLVSGSYGRYDERAVTGVLNVPIVADRVALRVAGNIFKRDGYLLDAPFVFNGVTLPTAVGGAVPLTDPRSVAGASGRKIGDRDNWTVRGKLLVQATDDLSLLFSAEQFKFDSFAQNWRLAAVDPNSAANTEAGLELGAPAASAAALGRAFFAAYIPYAQSGDHVSMNEDPRTYAKTQTYTGTANLATGFGAVKFIGGWRRIQSFGSIDLDGSPTYLFGTLGDQDLKQYSGELQVTGKAFDDAVDFAAGGFYFKEYGFDRAGSISLPVASTLAPGTRLARNRTYGVIDTRSKGLYGQATWRLTEALSVTGGLRYSVEDKGITTYNGPSVAATGVLIGCSITNADPTSTPPCRLQRSDRFDGVSYTAGVNYKLGDDTLIYAKTSKGFRSGGQNLRAQGVGGVAFVPFEPEVTHEHELGLKTEQFDRRLRFNVAAYYNRVNDIQRSTLVTFINPLTGGQGQATIVGNAGKVRNYGGEAEATALLFDGFTLAATASYTKPKYLEYLGRTAAGAIVDRRRERFEQVPEWTATLSAAYEREIAFGRLSLNANYAWQDTTPIGTFNFYTDAAGVTRDVSSQLPITLGTARVVYAAQTQKAGGQLNLRAALALRDGALEVAVWGRNVNNFRPNVSSLFFAPPVSMLAVQKRDPATYGATVTYRFE
jgi:iron complex outermembrane receptor protein